MKFNEKSDQKKLSLAATERNTMDALRELYIAYSELHETEKALEESDKQLFDYLKLNIPKDEKTNFYEIINSIMSIREEYFFKTGFKAAVKLLSECHK